MQARIDVRWQPLVLIKWRRSLSERLPDELFVEALAGVRKFN